MLWWIVGTLTALAVAVLVGAVLSLRAALGRLAATRPALDRSQRHLADLSLRAAAVQARGAAIERRLSAVRRRAATASTRFPHRRDG